MFATGVTIVTARDANGAPVGLTANSFNSVSLDPPLVLWSLSRLAGSMPHFSRGSHYAINILAAEQRDLAERFSRKTWGLLSLELWQQTFHDRAADYRRMLDEVEPARVAAQ